MTFTSQQAKSLANSRKRDEKGHFIKSKVTVDSPLEDTERSRSVVDPESIRRAEFEKPLVSVSVNNPFKKILYWLDQIRRHQTTTFVLKLSIPLIALPVVILGVFSLGRVYGINFQKTQTPPVPSSIIPSPAPVTISRAGTLKIAVSETTRYLLSLKNGELVVLDIPPTINLLKYQNKQVLVTGTYNKATNILKVTDIAEVQLFNATVVTPIESSSSSTINSNQ